MVRAVTEKGINFRLKTENVENNHYVVVVPNEWNVDKIAESILRPIFIDAKLITEDNPPCRLTFVDKPSTMFYSLQRCLSIFDDYGKDIVVEMPLKKNKYYAMFEVDFEHYSDEASVSCTLTQTTRSKKDSMNNKIEVLEPHIVNHFREINLDTINDIKKCLLKLLEKKDIITAIQKESCDRRGIDELLEKMIEIEVAYECISDVRSCPFRDLNFVNYKIHFTNIQYEALHKLSNRRIIRDPFP